MLVIFLSPVLLASIWSMRLTDLLALRTSLREAARLGFSNFIAKGDSFYAIRWASCSAAYPWRMADICEVLELAFFPL